MKRNGKIALVIGILASVSTLIYTIPRIVDSFGQQVDVSGEWRVEFYIYKSTYSPYIGKSSTYRIFLSQEGDIVIGKGEMWEVNLEEIPYSQHIPIVLEGKCVGDSLILTYLQKGALRESTGHLRAQVSGNEVSGTFRGTAAKSSGILAGIRHEF